MVIKELIKKIEQLSKQGMSRGEIKTSLIEAGWEEQDIDDAFTFLSNLDPSAPSEEPKKSKKKIIMILSIVGTFLFLTTGVLGYFYFFASPQRVLLKMVMNVSNLTTFEYSGDIEGKANIDQVLGASTSILGENDFVEDTSTSEASNTTVSFSGRTDISNIEQPEVLFSSNINSELMGEVTTIGLEVRLIQDMLYLKVGGIEELLGFFGLQALDNQWIELESSDVEDSVGVELDSDETSPEILDVLTENPEVIIITEKFSNDEIDGVGTYHYAYEIEKGILIQILRELSSDSSTDPGESFQDVESITGEIWIGKKDYYPYKLTLNVKANGSEDAIASEGFDLTLFLKSFNQPVQIDVPSDVMTLEEVMYQS